MNLKAIVQATESEYSDHAEFINEIIQSSRSMDITPRDLHFSSQSSSSATQLTISGEKRRWCTYSRSLTDSMLPWFFTTDKNPLVYFRP